jgi:hypothetical protein
MIVTRGNAGYRGCQLDFFDSGLVGYSTFYRGQEKSTRLWFPNGLTDCDLYSEVNSGVGKGNARLIPRVTHGRYRTCLSVSYACLAIGHPKHQEHDCAFVRKDSRLARRRNRTLFRFVWKDS